MTSSLNSMAARSKSIRNRASLPKSGSSCRARARFPYRIQSLQVCHAPAIHSESGRAVALGKAGMRTSAHLLLTPSERIREVVSLRISAGAFSRIAPPAATAIRPLISRRCAHENSHFFDRDAAIFVLIYAFENPLVGGLKFLQRN
jgi:hypothetical protein